MYYHNFYNLDPFKPTSLEFDVWSSDDIKKLSVVKINTSLTFDELGYPVAGGLYDSRLGPLKFNSDPCTTCGNNMMKCSGHFGHIELPFPVFNPLFIDIIVNILRISCLNCHIVLLPEKEKYILIAQLKLIDLGYLLEAEELDLYLITNSHKEPDEIQNEIAELYNSKLCEFSTNRFCKSINNIWKRYTNKIFQIRKKICSSCKKKINRIWYERGRLLTNFTKGSMGKEKTYLIPLEVKEHLRKLWENEKDLLKTLIKTLSSSSAEHPTDICFVSSVLITPSNTRPIQFINEKSIEHPKNNLYKLILQDNLQIQGILKVMNKRENQEISKDVMDMVNSYRGNTINEKLHYAWHSLQINVNSLLDASILKSYVNMNVGISKIGLKQLIEKKEGIIRKNMMGKRVDFFARSVITPDPLLNIHEIGIPDSFAKKLTFPVPVSTLNVDVLRKAVLNGPEVYPGANNVESDTGAVIWISGTNVGSREGLAKTLLTPDIDSKAPKVVHRHILDGDILLLNRQPSLHKPSIMAHKARILKGEKTFRLHYANCKAYNADFDGDEMNAHLPQGELARAEASEVANVGLQYLVPRDGTPLSGLIQDHVISAYRLSIRGKFFTRSEYHQLVFQGLCFFTDDISLLPPAIIKPKHLWSGKQVISTLLINLIPKNSVPLNLISKSKIPFNTWFRNHDDSAYLTAEEKIEMSETRVIIRNGELLCGVLDKNHVGSTHYGLIHYIYELYGGICSVNVLSAFSKLLTYYLQKDSFTLGVLDILIRKKPDRKRFKITNEIATIGQEAVKKALNISTDEEISEENLTQSLEICYKKNPNFRSIIDYQYKVVLDQYTNKINKICLPDGLLQPFPLNNLQLMVQSGAKGSTVNAMQISCALGQIELEGKRPPLMITGKALPCFSPYDSSPIAGGFIASRFMTGLQPEEFFFHCMAGREGLIDTAVKTSRSGYLQRCLVKHLESLIVHYDLTVRDADSSVIQYQYGEDGLDVLKSQLLKPDQMQFFADNLNSFYDKKIKKVEAYKSEKMFRKRKSQIYSKLVENNFNLINRTRNSGFLRFCKDMCNDKLNIEIDKMYPGRTDNATKLCHIWHSMLPDEHKLRYEETNFRSPDPILSMFKPDVNFGSVSEKIEKIIYNYMAENENSATFKQSKFKNVVYWKAFSSLCQPGEAVGVLAAQSVGEPSTQMTLNTFHFAGRGEMNVTLGIPRLREILMVASKDIKTPNLEIPFKPDVHKVTKKAEKLRKNLMCVTLKDVLEKIEVKETIRIKNHSRVYVLHLYYLPQNFYSKNTNICPENIIKYVEEKFTLKLIQMLKKYLIESYNKTLVTNNERKRTNKKENDDNDNDFDENISFEKIVKQEVNEDSSSGDESDFEKNDDANFKNRESDSEDNDDDEEKNEDIFYEINDSIINESTDIKNENLSNDETDIEPSSVDKMNIKSNMNEVKLKPNVNRTKGTLVKTYGVKKIEHDTINLTWSKITLWSSLSYKSLDLSSLLPNVVEKAIIHETPGIKRAITFVNNEGVLILKTEGSKSMHKLFEYDQLLDLNKLYSNDIHAMAEMYGIEAANRVIVQEILDVFKVYGITVDFRHLSLIADYMTYDGTYQPLNRKGIENSSSPLQQMTFESSLKFLRNATVRKLKDNLQSLSSCLIVGKEPRIGSGLIEVYNK